MSGRPCPSRSRSIAAGVLLVLASGSAVVVHVAGIPPPETGTIGEGGPATEAALNSADEIAVAPNGDIYIADSNSSRLLRIRDGILTVAYRGDFSAGENDMTGAVVAPDGTVYFTTGLAVMMLSPDGTPVEIIPLDPVSFQAQSPKLAIAGNGDLLVGGGRIPRIDRLGADRTTTLIAGADEAATEPGVGDGGPALEARFGRVSDLAIDSEGVIYLADEDFGDVRRIGPDGVITTVFGSGPVSFNEAIDGTLAVDVGYASAEISIAVDSSDRLYVLPRLAGKVWMIDGGAITTVLGGGPNRGTGFAPLETQLEGGSEIALTNEDDLLVLVEDGRFLYQSGGVAPSGGLVDSVPSPSRINLDPLVIAASLGLAAGMVFLVPFPAEFFNNTISEHHDQIKSWFRRKRREAVSTAWEKRWGLALGLVAMALLYGFLDPGFGLNAASIPTFVGLLLGVLITTLGFALPTLLMRRARNGDRGRMRILPVALLVGVTCVVISRVINFQPGYLYGMVLGLIFGIEIDDKTSAREVAVTSLVMVFIATIAWFGLGAVRSGESGTLTDLTEATLAMTTVAAFEALVFGLLPIHGMPGKVLFRHRRWLWAVIWSVAVLAFFHILVNPQSGYLVDTALVPVAATYGLLAFFTLVSAALWGWFRLQDRKRVVSYPTIDKTGGV